MAAISRKTFEDIDKAAKSDAASPASQFPTGIIDGWKANENYRSLLLNMKINDITNDDAVVLIKEAIDLIANDTQKTQIVQIYERRDHELYMDVDADKKDKDQKIIYIWRTTKLPLKVIAQKLDQTIDKVSKVIKNYKRMVRSQLKYNSKRAAKARRKIDNDDLEEIKEFWIGSVHRSICVDDVKKAVWGSQEIKKPPSNPTIATAMKRRLKMSYRTLSTKHPKTLSADSKRLSIEAAIIQVTSHRN